MGGKEYIDQVYSEGRLLYCRKRWNSIVRHNVELAIVIVVVMLHRQVYYAIN